MVDIIKFLDRIHLEKNLLFEDMVVQYDSKYIGTHYYNGETLKIENQSDFFLYLSEDKKKTSFTWDSFDKNINFSYLIYFSYYHHVAKYKNGGLKFIGFYNNKYEKIKNIKIKEFSIIDCKTDCNFDDLKRPSFSYEILSENGNKHHSIRGSAQNLVSCQKVLENIWEIETFYSNQWDKRIHSPI